MKAIEITQGKLVTTAGVEHGFSSIKITLVAHPNDHSQVGLLVDGARINPGGSELLLKWEDRWLKPDEPIQIRIIETASPDKAKILGPAFPEGAVKKALSDSDPLKIR